MVLAARTFRIFVSSTFSDLVAERNALQERVFPRLKDFCLQREARFQAIDLRWGVSEEAGLDQRTMTICLDEIDRCRDVSPRPNFIVLLGDRYGWRPLPPEIPADEFDEIHALVADKDDLRLLEHWYPRDDNARYRRKPEDEPQAIHVLRPRKVDVDPAESEEAKERAREEEAKAWEKSEADLRWILRAAVGDLDEHQRANLHLDDEALGKYYASATEQEIARGALRVEDAREHVFCFFRTIPDLPLDHEKAKDFTDLLEDGTRDVEAQASLAALKATLEAKVGKGNFFPFTVSWADVLASQPPETDEEQDAEAGASPAPAQGPDVGQEGADPYEGLPEHLRDLCRHVHDSLRGIIEQEIERMKEVDPLEKEIAAHEEFGDDRARFFTGRTEILERVASYTGRPEGKPLVVWGASGSGKSAVMAHAAQQAREDHPDSVVLRFIGATPESSNGRALLAGLCKEISGRYGGDESTIPSDYRELVRDFPERLALASSDRPLILFLDALDQLSEAEGAQSLSWLPSDLPAGVGLVVSTLPEGTLAPLKARFPDSSFAELEPMRSGEGAALLDLWLEDAGRTLREPQRTELLGKFEVERLPLWLRLAFQEARLWRSDDEFPRIELPATTPEIIRDKLFDRLDDPENHGEVMVSHSLGYLAAAKNGLSEDEMIEALSLSGRGGTVLKDFFRRSPKSPKVDQLPVVVWSRLFFDLEPYLTERAADGASLMTFYHRQLAEAVTEVYLDGDEGLARHRELARCFDEKPLQIAGEQDTTPNLRKLSELPYQQTMGELWDDMFTTLTDFEFLERKAADMGFVESTDAQGNTVKTYTGIYQIRDDYALALERMPGDGGGAGGRGGRRRIIVTGVDFGNGLVIRCPHCNTLHPFREEWKGQEIDCPNEECKGPLKVNPFVVERPR